MVRWGDRLNQQNGEAQMPNAVLAPESDEALAARASMDRAAMDELYRRSIHRIYGYCRLRLHDDDDVQEVTSAIVLKALEGLRRTRIDRFEPWIFTIAHNELSNWFRGIRPTIDLTWADQIPDTAAMPEDVVITRAENDRLRAVIRQLAPDQQRVVELRLAGLDGRQIGEILGRRRGWVDTTQYRAVRRLRELMAISPDGKDL